MGIEMYLGSSDQQAQSVGSVLGNRLNAYQSLQASLSQFIHDSASLSGHTYDSAKAYSQQILHPLIKGCILLDEAVNTACSKLPSQYRSQVDQVDLKEDELVEQIYKADLFISRYMELIALEYRQDQPSYSYISSLRSSEDRYRSLKQKLEEKLQKLRAFDGSSVYLFSNIQPLIAAVQAGMRQATSSWNAETKVFTLPPAKDMDWVKQVDERWEKSPSGIQELIAKAEKGFELSLEELNHLTEYLKSNPHFKDSDRGLQVLQKAIDKSVGIPDDVLENIVDLLFGSTHTVDKEASFDRELSFWFSSYTKYQSAIEIDEPGIFKGSFENGFPVGVAIDLSVISLSVDITDAHISVNPTISLFGYQLNVKSDIGFDTKNNYPTPEVNFSFGYGETDKWSQDWGIKVSTDVWNGVVGGYGRYTTMTKIDDYSHSVNSIETGFQTLNGIHAIAIVGVFMVPELVLPLISSPAFLK